MKLAIIGDIHSNKSALRAVLEDIKEKDVDTILCTGDIVGYLANPNKVIDLLKINNVLCIKGNHDQRVANTEQLTLEDINKLNPKNLYKKGSLVHTRYHISDESIEYLKNLPESITMSFKNLSLKVVHGGLNQIDEYIYDESENMYETASKLKEDILIYGHTHLPLYRELGSKIFINPGSVGKPKDKNYRASYCLLTIDDGVHCEFIKVDYPVEVTLDKIEKSPWISNDLIDNIKNGY